MIGKPLIYGSVCSGIEAATAAWHPLGWKAAFFSEIEPFPRAVLKHHYPDVPLHGDFTTIQKGNYEPIQLLVGGTPCQSFSIAGLRGGMDDHRGNLALEFCKLADRLKPAWILWENVPGVLSSNGGKDIVSILDAIETLGYVVDVEILDAQFHGVPQRRRRVFICGQHISDLVNQMTDSSALTIAQCWQEILHGILALASKELGIELGSSESASLSNDGVMRRMKLFGLDGEIESFNLLRMNLIEAYRRSQREQNDSVVRLGGLEKELTPADPLMDSQAVVPFILTEASLSVTLEESYEVMRSFITLMGTSSITRAQIYTCSKAALLIAKLIPLLNQSCPPFWSAASSSLTAIQEFTNYARQTSSSLFGDVERVQAWSDFITEAEPTIEIIGCIGIENFGDIFIVSNSLSGNSPPSRKTRKENSDGVRDGVAGSIGAHHTEGWPGSSTDIAGAFIPEVLHTLGDTTKGGANDMNRLGALIAHGVDGLDVGYSLRSNPSHSGDKGDGGLNTTLVSTHFEKTGTVTTIRSSGPMNDDNAAVAGHLISYAPDLAPSWTARDGKGERQDVSEPSLIAIHPHVVGRAPDAGPQGKEYLEDGSAYTMDSRGVPQVVAYTIQTNDGGAHKRKDRPNGGLYVKEADVSLTVGSTDAVRVATATSVRRLTPRECERLQGLPDDYTLIPLGKRNKKLEQKELHDFAERTGQNIEDFKWSADGSRYKAIGNSMAVPVMRWIGERIQMVEDILEERTHG